MRAIVSIHPPTNVCMWGLLSAMLCDSTRIHNRFSELSQSSHNKNPHFPFL